MKWMIAFVLFVYVGVSLAFAADLDGVQFMKIAAAEQRAVVKLANGSLKLVRIGDQVGAAALHISEISEGRVVLVDAGQDGPETIIVRLENGQQRIERISRQIEQPIYIAPQ